MKSTSSIHSLRRGAWHPRYTSDKISSYLGWKSFWANRVQGAVYAPQESAHAGMAALPHGSSPTCSLCCMHCSSALLPCKPQPYMLHSGAVQGIGLRSCPRITSWHMNQRAAGRRLCSTKCLLVTCVSAVPCVVTILKHNLEPKPRPPKTSRWTVRWCRWWWMRWTRGAWSATATPSCSTLAAPAAPTWRILPSRCASKPVRYAHGHASSGAYIRLPAS